MKLSKSPRVNEALYAMGIFSYLDVLFHLPRNYADFTPTREVGLEHKERLVFSGKLAGAPTYARHGRVAIVKFAFLTNNGHFFRVTAFNRPYLMKILILNETYTLIGSYDKNKMEINLVNIVKGEMGPKDRIKPIYSLPNTLENYMFIRLVEKAFLEAQGQVINVVPELFMKKYQLLPKEEALRLVHQPSSLDDVYTGLRVLKYEECLLFSLKTQIIREENKVLVKEAKNPINLLKINDFIKTLPYKLTHDQVDAVRETILDMNKPNLMYRLLQGDVGSGKTVVAALALYANYLRHDQGAIMAPTDSLARQHYRTFKELFKNTPVKISLLVGSFTNAEKNQIKEDLLDGNIDIIVGTHALFTENVTYQSLGLAVIDEQHRFGVNQRLLLASKGSHADLLLMSATPIPRTLALTLYGDLDVTTLTQFPFQERKITTKIIESTSLSIYKAVDEALANDKRVYVIAPIILMGEDDHFSVEKLFPKFLLKYPGKVALLHGKMDQDEKESALEDFAKGKTPILVATSVIEVGIDVKTASLMIIYDAPRFGLASLHQLRGRIGRDGTPATCLLVDDGLLEEDQEKLKVLVDSNDGFHIAEEDLKRRGPGEMSGYRQSGMPNFNFVNLVSDFKMFEYAREDAKFILKEPLQFKALIAQAKKEALQAKFTNV